MSHEQLRSFRRSGASLTTQAFAKGVHAYNLFSISEQDLPRAFAMHRGFFNSLRGLIRDSEPSESIVLYACQLLPLDEVGASADDAHE